MSGEKCTHYSVLENARLREARLRNLREAAAAAGEKLREIAGRAGALAGEEMPASADKDSETELQRYIAAAGEMALKLEARLRRRDALRHLDSLSSGGTAGSWSGPAEAAPAEVQRKGDDAARQGRSALAARLLGRLEDSSQARTDALQTLVSKLIDSDDQTRAARIEDELRHAVVEANAEAKRERDRARVAQQLLDSLRGMTGVSVEAARRDLEAMLADRRAVPQSLIEATELARRDALERIDREYALEVLREELRNAGYEVPDRPFDVAVAAGGEIVLPDARNRNYAVKLDVDPARAQFGMAVVRFDDGRPRSPLQARRDREVEDDFCERHARVRDALRNAGIDNSLVRHFPSGFRPVQTVAAPRKAEPGHAEERQERSKPGASG